MLREAVVLFLVVGVAFAAVALGPAPPVPEKYKGQEGCYIEELDRMVTGSAPSKKSCMEYRCTGKMIQYVSCGAISGPPGCTEVADKNKPYPECCPKIKCP